MAGYSAVTSKARTVLYDHFGSSMSESIRIRRRKMESITNEKSGCHREVPSQLNERRIHTQLAKYSILNLRIPNKHTCPFYVSGSFRGNMTQLFSSRLLYATTDRPTFSTKLKAAFKSVLLYPNPLKSNVDSVIKCSLFFGCS